MSTALTAIFGTEIKVIAQPRTSQRQYVGFPGCHGLASMWMGTRGYAISIAGRLRATGASYAIARATLQTAIDGIETYLAAGADTYTHAGCTYQNVVFDSFRILPGAGGGSFKITADNYVACDFVCIGRSLL